MYRVSLRENKCENMNDGGVVILKGEGSLQCIQSIGNNRMESVTDPALLSSDAGSANEDIDLDLEYDHDYMQDPLIVTVVESEETVIEPLSNSTIAVKKDDGSKEYCVIVDMKPVNDDNNFMF